MKTIKYILCVFLVFFIGLFFISCKKDNNQEEEEVEDKIESVSFLVSELSLKVGDNYQVILVVSPSNMPYTATFKSNNTNIATISRGGVIEALSAGNTTITVEIDLLQSQMSLNVREDEVVPPLPPVPPVVNFDGEGTFENPFLIPSLEKLLLLRDLVIEENDITTNYFLQTQDIDLISIDNWEPIGVGGIPFEGTYDGNNKKIENLSINSNKSFQGLFGFVTGTIKNVNVYGNISIHFVGAYSHSIVGGIAGAINNGAIIDNCNNYVNIEADSFAGGIVGEIFRNDFLQTREYAQVINCTNYGTITGDDRSAIYEEAKEFGGIAGENYGLIKNCVNNGDIILTGENTAHAGGITGYHWLPYQYGTDIGEYPNSVWSLDNYEFFAIENCVNNGNITANSYAGGIAGQAVFGIKNCINNGNINGDRMLAGIVGMEGTTGTKTLFLGVISGCTNNGNINGVGKYLAGIVGYSYNAIDNCINYGNIQDGEYAGGIAGLNASPVTNSKNYGFVKGSICIGGISGVNGRSDTTEPIFSKIINCDNYGDVTISSRHGGGITGYSYFNIENSTNEGNILGGPSSYNIGGIAGYLSSGNILECIAVSGGVITGYYGLGGIVGWNLQSGSLIENCVNNATIQSLNETSGASHIGGIVGMHGSTNTIKNCTNNARIIGVGGNDTASTRTGGVGGIAGSFYRGSIVTNSTNNGEIFGRSRIGGIVGYGDCNSYSVIESCINTGIIHSSTPSAAYTGCIVGYMTSGKILNCINYGLYEAISAATNIGYIYGYQLGVTLTNNQDLHDMEGLADEFN
ncbi:MAG: Ig-like domain-containing protein [Acholeplasmatales bacterium]|jgi:hypothetical protein|nr:Ig-like domain-containing protein [Acholeplasmatales bacterium]